MTAWRAARGPAVVAPCIAAILVWNLIFDLWLGQAERQYLWKKAAHALGEARESPSTARSRWPCAKARGWRPRGRPGRRGHRAGRLAGLSGRPGEASGRAVQRRRRRRSSGETLVLEPPCSPSRSHTELGDGWSPAIAAGVILAIALAVMLIPGPHDSIADRLPLVAAGRRVVPGGRRDHLAGEAVPVALSVSRGRRSARSRACAAPT